MMDYTVGVVRWIARLSFTQFVLRLAVAVTFWNSGVHKWSGFLQLSNVAVHLFSDNFKLYLPGGPYDFPVPATIAFLSGCVEIIFPVFLVLGLCTRFAATGLLLMTYVVQLTMPGGWRVHITWVAMELAVMAWGPGRLSLDYAFRAMLIRAAKTDYLIGR
jgi:putative oxidoreductase